MPQTYLGRLRRKRARLHMQINRLEPILAGYRAKLAATEAAIQRIAPELNLPPRRYRPNPYFARGELPRLAMAIMREAGEPLATRTIAVRALAAKGIALPTRTDMKRARQGLQQIMWAWSKRGLVRSIGDGRRTLRVLTAGAPIAIVTCLLHAIRVERYSLAIRLDSLYSMAQVVTVRGPRRHRHRPRVSETLWCGLSRQLKFPAIVPVRSTDGWSSGRRHRTITPAYAFTRRTAGSNPAPSATQRTER